MNQGKRRVKDKVLPESCFRNAGQCFA
ncbi:hypothetical protein LCGC14_2320990, partial [marine sediment metagenome]